MIRVVRAFIRQQSQPLFRRAQILHCRLAVGFRHSEARQLPLCNCSSTWPRRPPTILAKQPRRLTLNQPIRGSTVLAANDYEVASPCFYRPARIDSQRPRCRLLLYRSGHRPTTPFASATSIPMTTMILFFMPLTACPAGPEASKRHFLPRRRQFAPMAAAFEEIFCLHLTASQHIFIVVDDDNGDLNASPVAASSSRPPFAIAKPNPTTLLPTPPPSPAAWKDPSIPPASLTSTPWALRRPARDCSPWSMVPPVSPAI
jgi:hypothetical protein